jgi:hypothetical protein
VSGPAAVTPSGDEPAGPASSWSTSTAFRERPASNDGETSGLNEADQPVNAMIPEHQERKEICTGAACLFALRVLRPSLLALRSARFAGYGGRFLEAQPDPPLEEFWKRVQDPSVHPNIPLHTRALAH